MGITTKNYFQKIFDKNLQRLRIKQILCFSLILLLFGGTFVSLISFSLNYGRNVYAQEVSANDTSSANTNSTATGSANSTQIADVILEHYSIETGKPVTRTQNVTLSAQTQDITVEMPAEAQITHIKEWAAWKIELGEQFHIHVLSSPELNDERMKAIYDAVFSKETLVQDGKTLYKGWYGTVNYTQNTKFPMAVHFDTVSTDDGTGHILIELTHLKNPDGYVGFTKLITDNDIHHLLKSKITIYNVENLSIENFKALIRHELGHGFGLDHSDDPDDLMYEVVKISYPYISECDIKTIVGLYSGSEKSRVSCEE